jgi:gamma-glutamylputrescine oxidase
MDYEEHGGYEIFKNTDGNILGECLDSLGYFNKHLSAVIKRENIYVKSKKDFGFANTHAILIHNTAEGQINVGKMMQRLIALAKQHNVLIFNGLKIEKIQDSIDLTSQWHEGCVLTTEEGWEISTKKVLVATNGFARRLMPELDVTPARNQVLITKPIENLNIKGCFHYDKGYYYFRNVGNRILLGGGRNLDFQGEQTDDFNTTQNIQNALKNLLSEVILPQKKVEIDMWWSGILGIGKVKKPIIKHVSSNVVVAVRMGGMGVAIGSLVGEEAADLLMS